MGEVKGVARSSINSSKVYSMVCSLSVNKGNGSLRYSKAPWFYFPTSWTHERGRDMGRDMGRQSIDEVQSSKFKVRSIIQSSRSWLNFGRFRFKIEIVTPLAISSYKHDISMAKNQKCLHTLPCYQIMLCFMWTYNNKQALSSKKWFLNKLIKVFLNLLLKT